MPISQQTNNIDLEQCFSDGEEQENGSCHSQFYSTFGDDDVLERSSFSDCSVEGVGVNNNDSNNIGDGGHVVMLHLVDKDCRICHLSLVGDDGGDGDGGGDVIELGCCCKDDLAAAHKHCAETWFKIKGNKTCEICNSIVSNLVVPNEIHGTATIMDVNLEETSVATTYRTATTTMTRGRGCINGHRILNFILACLVFAFVISWLFHFNIPS